VVRNSEESPEVTLGKDISQVEQRMKFQAAELEKMTAIHDQLIAKENEVEKLKIELHESGTKPDRRKSLMPSLAPTPPKQPEKKKRVTIAPELYQTADEFFEEQEFSDSDSEDEEDDDSDPEWKKTPMFRRLKQERAAVKESRQSLAVPKSKRKRSSPFDSDEEGEERSKKRTSTGGCCCKTDCRTKRCKCKKEGGWCSDICKCGVNKCINKEGHSFSSTLEISNKENVSMTSESDADNTASLLSNTFDKSMAAPNKQLKFSDSPDLFSDSPANTVQLLQVPSRDTKSPRSPLKTVFKTPVKGSPLKHKQLSSASETDEVTPTNKSQKVPGSFFTSPQLH